MLKKPGLDHQHDENFRPICKLTFLSEVIEKVKALQLVDYIDSIGLYQVFQSAYRANHDIALFIDNRKSVVLVLLDLSAAFATVDHFFPLSRLSARLASVTIYKQVGSLSLQAKCFR